MSAFLESMPDKRLAAADWSMTLPRVNEAICVPTQARTPCLALCLPSLASTDAQGSASALCPAYPDLPVSCLVAPQVNYVGKAANLYQDAGYELQGSSYVINKLIGTSWMWDRVRVSGGAYGAFTDFNSHR